VCGEIRTVSLVTPNRETIEEVKKAVEMGHICRHASYQGW
jgi:hypothetical protein